ncbi:MAG: T9SS type A sorting domain-containing protein [Thermoplasmata archaeon]
MKIICFVILIIHASYFSQTTDLPIDLDYGVKNDDHYDKEKLKYISFNCEHYYLYPVFIEDFNYLSDVRQNFQFWSGFSTNDAINNSDCGSSKKPVTYFGGDDFMIQNGNVKCINGKLILERKKQDITISNYSSGHFCLDPGDFPYTYNFTGGNLWSFFRVRKGIVEADIKFPEFPYLWQAFWLYGNDTNRQEIDIVEYIPNKNMDLIGNCNKGIAPYCYYNFTIHNEQIYPNYNAHHKRWAKLIPTSDVDEFFDVSHKYTLYWDDYKVDCYLDDTHIVRGRKYIDGKDKDNTNCDEKVKGPKFSWSCFGASAQSFKTPNKKIFIDRAFPIDDRSMQVIVEEKVHYNAFKNAPFYNKLLTDFDNLQEIDKQVVIDRLVIYQPVLLNGNLTIPNLNTFYTHSRNSSFLAANKIEFGPNASIHVHTPAAPNWNQVSMHAIAGEHIIITDEFIYEEGNYLRLETSDFSGGFLYGSKYSNGWDEVIYDIEEDDEENKKENEDKNKLGINEMIYPNPAYDIINYNTELIEIIRITDVAGREIKLEINKNIIDVSDLNKGIYFVLYRNKKTNEGSIWKFIKE